MSEGPLAGVRVLDLSRVFAGPWATQALADLGAEVIKVERPGRGDDARGLGPPFLPDQEGKDSAESAFYLSANRNKKSIALDLSLPRGQDIIRKFAAISDVVVENFKVGTLIPAPFDQNSCAHWRRPMDMILQGWSTSLFHASQQWSTRSS
jgi:crotonobetainyl-CoA:carnitine CoA-transferase CaiB-like acyl-CoA transferase